MAGEIPVDLAGSARLRVEILVSFMPTPVCVRLLELFQAMLLVFPDRMRLDVYKAGEQPSVVPSDGFAAAGKRKKVPSAFVNGRLVASAEVPCREEIEALIRAELGRM